MTNKALILGCQRSGTTLLGMILQAHSSVEVIEENNGRFHQIYALTRLLDLARVDSYQSTDAKLAVFKAPRDSHRICEIEQTLPQAKTIWVSREVNQVVASMLSLKTQGGVPWALQFAEKEVIKYLYTTLGSFQIADGFS